MDHGYSSRGKIWAMSVLTLGIIVGSFIMSIGLNEGLKHIHPPHAVTVKGLSEKMEKADLVLWTLQFSSTGNDLSALQIKIETDMKNVTDFLKSQGLAETEFAPGRLNVVDLMARQYRSNEIKDDRYILSASVTVRSDKVELVQTISRNIGTLIKSGVIFASNENGLSSGPQYVFTKINDIKLDMLAEATHNARAAAEQFARDSGEHLGPMIEANQGTFSILPADGASLSGTNDYADQMTEKSQILKKIRVVSTVKYELSN